MNGTRLSHACMLVGPEGAERSAAATRLAAAMLCTGTQKPCGQCRDCRKVFAGTHPDIMTIGREAGRDGKERQAIVVEQIRRVTADAVIAPNEGSVKVYIFDPADRMNPAAQNALLKSLEDPPGHSCYILCTASSEALLPTIRSRCVQQPFGTSASAQTPLDENVASFLRLTADGDRAALLLLCMRLAACDRDETASFLDAMQDAAADLLAKRRHDPAPNAGTLLFLNDLADNLRLRLQRNITPKQIFTVLAAETVRYTER